jgi:hypothetical protein
VEVVTLIVLPDDWMLPVCVVDTAALAMAGLLHGKLT